MKIGIMGGTFDPIHFGHKEMARFCLEEFKLDKIMFLPLGDAPHKDKVTNKEVRFEMLNAALKGQDDFFVSRIELDRIGKTYTFDTLNFLKENTTDEYYFIIGGDTVNTLHKWYRVDDVLKMVEFIVVLRENADIKESIIELQSRGGRFKLTNHMGLEISSTEIKRRVKNNENIDNLVDDSVRKIIEKNGLYKN
ncbi:MAG: nicotinate-nucleotide adenylyltransferase [Clostridia bacterium]|nr:nicotinate-nucleotide adenylyltransferase [Clostridia bacterium]